MKKKCIGENHKMNQLFFLCGNTCHVSSRSWGGDLQLNLMGEIEKSELPKVKEKKRKRPLKKGEKRTRRR
jgi:hypothetical protein